MQDFPAKPYSTRVQEAARQLHFRAAQQEVLCGLERGMHRRRHVIPPARSGLDTWLHGHQDCCLNKGATCTASDGAALRYNALDGRKGGRIAVRVEDFDTFAAAVYDDCIKGNNPACLSEVPGAHFKAFMDLDYVAPCKHALPTAAVLKRHIAAAQAVMEVLFPALTVEQRSVIVAVGNVHQKGDGERAMMQEAASASEDLSRRVQHLQRVQEEAETAAAIAAAAHPPALELSPGTTPAYMAAVQPSIIGRRAPDECTVQQDAPCITSMLTAFKARAAASGTAQSVQETSDSQSVLGTPVPVEAAAAVQGKGAATACTAPWKRGVHLVWPSVIVTANIMAAVAECARVLLTQVAPLPEGCGAWEDVLDNAVYRRPCLRLPYTYKSMRCPCSQMLVGDASRRGRQPPCALRRCYNGRVHDLAKGVYVPMEVFNGNMQCSLRYGDNLKSPVHAMRAMSLWVRATRDMRQDGPRGARGALLAQAVWPATHLDAPHDLPPSARQAMDRIAMAQVASRNGKVSRGVHQGAKVLPAGDKRYLVLQRILRASAPQYKHVTVKPAGVYCRGSKAVKADAVHTVTHYAVDVVGHGCRCCANRVGGTHTSSQVFFVVTRAGVHQHCYSHGKVTNRKNGSCSRVQHFLCVLHASDVQELFGART